MWNSGSYRIGSANDSEERFRSDGCFHLVGATALRQVAMSPVVVIDEGYATAATIAKHGKVSTSAAYDSGNLLFGRSIIRERWLDKAIIIARDDDHSLENNPGREKALAAARPPPALRFPQLQRRTARERID